jgi:hypothetical protein
MNPQQRDNILVKTMMTGGLVNAATALRASRQVGLELSAACASLAKESAGRNVFGGDPWNRTAYPRGMALPVRWREQAVTRWRYTVYKIRRALGMQPNGVGPCQLTSANLQREAESAGGCWKVLPNMQVGFRLLKGLIDAHGGVQGGFAAYNGSGPAAAAYGLAAVAEAAAWHRRFADAGVM